MLSASPSPRASVWEWTQTALLVANLGWTTLYMGGYRPVAQIVTLLLTVAVVLTHFAARVWGEERVWRPLHPAGWWLLPFLLYAAANVVWVAPAKWLGWLDWLNWAQMVAVFWVVLNGIQNPSTRRFLCFMLMALGIAGVVLGCYQRFVQPEWVMVGERAPQFIGRASGSFSIPNSLAAWLLLLIPAAGALALRRRAGEMARVWWAWVAVVLLCGLILTLSRGAWLALAVSLVAWPLSLRRWRWQRRLTIAVAIVVVVGLGSVWVYRALPQVRERIDIALRDSGETTRPIMWRAAWELFREKPALGTGAASYNILFERHRPERFPDTTLWAHNEYLNTLADYGVVGFVLFFGAAGAIAVRCIVRRRGDDARRAGWVDSSTFTVGLAVGLLAFSLQMLVDFHLKIPALALAFATVAALAVGNRWPLERTAPAQETVPLRRPWLGRVGFALGAVVSGALVVGIFLPLLRAETERVTARRAIDRLGEQDFDLARYREVVPAARERLLWATRLYPRDGQAWADLAYVTSLMPLLEPARKAQLGKEAERAADRAIACSPAHAEFWIRRGTARDLQGRWTDARSDFVRATGLAPNNAMVWGYYADHLSRVPSAHEAAEAAVAFCLRLDPGNTLGLALRQRLAIKSGPR
ncbi:MAG: O-antigen ligase family protein [Verrucomicrobiota bacterium]